MTWLVSLLKDKQALKQRSLVDTFGIQVKDFIQLADLLVLGYRPKIPTKYETKQLVVWFRPTLT